MMRSGWFWDTDQWKQYETAYYADRMRPVEYKESPLDERPWWCLAKLPGYSYEAHGTQVLDLVTHEWSDLRKSYHSLIHRAQETYSIYAADSIAVFQRVHQAAFGIVRSQATYDIQGEWLRNGLARCVIAALGDEPVAAALWIVYEGSAYYASGPSLVKKVMHAVIWESLQQLRGLGVRFVELGQVDGETEKERNIGKFKRGFGGMTVPFCIARPL